MSWTGPCEVMDSYEVEGAAWWFVMVAYDHEWLRRDVTVLMSLRLIIFEPVVAILVAVLLFAFVGPVSEGGQVRSYPYGGAPRERGLV